MTCFLATDVHPAQSHFTREDEEAEIETAWVHLDKVQEGILAGRLGCPQLILCTLAYTARLQKTQVTRFS